jgi:putative ATP-binding cassette transporter
MGLGGQRALLAAGPQQRVAQGVLDRRHGLLMLGPPKIGLPMTANPTGFNTLLWRRFLAMARPYWSGDERWRARGLLGVLVLLLLGQTAFNVAFNEQSGELTSALAARDGERFWTAIRSFTLILVAAVPIWGCYYFVRDTLALRWRRWLTSHFLQRYLHGRAYYRLGASEALDNPDQRIAEDINSFTGQSLYFLMIVLGAVIQLWAFSSVLWGISRPLVGFLVAYAARCDCYCLHQHGCNADRGGAGSGTGLPGA